MDRHDEHLTPSASGRSPTVTIAIEAAVVGAAIVFGVVTLALGLGEGRGEATVLSYLLVVAAGLTLVARRRWPVAVLGLVALARILVAWESGGDSNLHIAVTVALYTVARGGDRRRHLGIAGAVAVVVAVALAALGQDAFLPELVGELALMLLPVAIGDAARSRADRLRTRIEVEAASRVQAERLRIARDLHDVVAHGLSTIAVQSGVAAHLIDRDRDQAKEALEIINRTGRASLEELRTMVGVLRSTEDVPLRPTPTDPNDLTDLLEGAEAAGVSVAVTVEGAFPVDVVDGSVVAVHRIIQEALTNVVRHGGSAPTRLSIRHGSDRVVVTITNAATAGGLPVTNRAPSTGVGLVGMAERAESLGGTVVAGPTPSGGFEVVATVPYQRRPVGDRSS